MSSTTQQRKMILVRVPLLVTRPNDNFDGSPLFPAVVGSDFYLDVTSAESLRVFDFLLRACLINLRNGLNHLPECIEETMVGIDSKDFDLKGLVKDALDDTRRAVKTCTMLGAVCGWGREDQWKAITGTDDEPDSEFVAYDGKDGKDALAQW